MRGRTLSTLHDGRAVEWMFGQGILDNKTIQLYPQYNQDTIVYTVLCVMAQAGEELR